MQPFTPIHAALAAVFSAAVLTGAAMAQTGSATNPSAAPPATRSNASTAAPASKNSSSTAAATAPGPGTSASNLPPSAGAATAAAAKAPVDKSASKSAASLSHADREFAIKAAQAGLAEVAAGKLAASNAANAEIKKFGEHMAQDHAKANDELMQIAQSKSLALPAEPDRSHQRMARQLQGLSGDKFDKTYMREAGVKDHKAAYALFSNEATKGKDPELRAFAQKTLPAIQEHMKMAQQLAQLSGRN